MLELFARLADLQRDWFDRFDFSRVWPDGWPPFGGNSGRPEVAPDQAFEVTIQEIDHGHVFGRVEASDDEGVTGYSIASSNPDRDGDGVRAFAIDEDGTLSIADLDDVDFGSDHRIDVAVRAHDGDGNSSAPELVSLALTSDPLIPKDTPFNYHIGINYESWEVGRTGYSIKADLDQITQDFKLIKTYHAAAVGTSDPTVPQIDATQAQVITYIAATDDLELVMGTENSALAQGGFGNPWAAGLMTDKAYTDKWVEMIIQAFGSVDEVKQHLKAVLLGNEIDANGPPPNDPSFNDYLGWIKTSFDNLKASLSDAGLDGVIVSTTIANYGSTNQVAVEATQYIHDSWGGGWNDDTPFVLYNQYTQGGATSTDFTPVEQYFERVQGEVPAGLEVFIGETGYSTTADPNDPSGSAQNQADVYKQIFAWLDGMDGQSGNGGPMVPMFPFVAFDRPDAGGIEVGYGIYGEDANSQPTGLKPDLAGVVPSWTDDPIATLTLDGDALTGTDDKDVFAVDSGTGSIDGGEGNHDLVMLNGEQDEFDFSTVRLPLEPGNWWDFFRADPILRIESKDGDATSLDLTGVEYVQFE
ncbi:MAG: hypothetical protein AAF414_23510, partial [Pseudomonadota bacterium]